MSTAIPPCVSSVVVGMAAHRELAGAPESPRCNEQRLRIQLPMVTEHGADKGAATPEACTDGDNDSSDDERRGLPKPAAFGAKTRAANGLRDSCRWLSRNNSFCAQPSLPCQEPAMSQRRKAMPSTHLSTTDYVSPGRACPVAGVALGTMMSPAPGALVQVARCGTTESSLHMMMDPRKLRCHAFNMSARYPPVVAIQTAATIASPPPRASLSAMVVCPYSKARASSHSHNTKSEPCGVRLVKHARVMCKDYLLLPPPSVTPTKKRKASSLASPSSTLDPRSTRKGLSWLEAEWAAAAAAAVKRVGGSERCRAREEASAEERPRPRPCVLAVDDSVDLSCTEQIDVDEVMNAGGEVRTPICRFLLPFWPEGVEGYEEVGGWRRLGGPAPEGGGSAK